MIPHDSGRNHIGDRTFQSHTHGLGLAGIRNGIHDNAGTHDFLAGHGDGGLRHGIHGGEPAFAVLLIAAGFIQRGNDEGLFGFKVGRRIVESHVTIFPDTHKSHVDDALLDFSIHFHQSLFQIGGIAFNGVEGLHRLGKTIQNSLVQIQTEGRRMIGLQAHIFIQMENVDLAPVDTGFFDQRIIGLILAGSAGENKVGFAAFGDGFADVFRTAGSGLLPHFFLGGTDGNLHCYNSLFYFAQCNLNFLKYTPENLFFKFLQGFY